MQSEIDNIILQLQEKLWITIKERKEMHFKKATSFLYGRDNGLKEAIRLLELVKTKGVKQ